MFNVQFLKSSGGAGLRGIAWLAFFLYQTSISGQNPADSFRLALQLPVQARFATADNLGQIYLVTPQNAIEKYAPDGRLLARYSNNRLGNAASIEVNNPLKVMVWYADFRTLLFLDRRLTALGELNLINAGFPEVRTVAAAQDGNLWVYDEVRFQLRKISPAGENLYESQALTLLGPERFQISCLRDDGNQVWAADAETGILQFDIYAQFQKLLPWKGISDFRIEQNQLIYLSGDTLQIEHLTALASRSAPLPATARKDAEHRWLAPLYLLVQKPEFLEVWLR